MEGTKNDIFNSEIHDIIETKSSEKISDNHIISVHKKGLIFNKILLRKATVTISKNNFFTNMINIVLLSMILSFNNIFI